MKRSKEDAAETRNQIIDTAAREFRKNGLQLSVADVMSAAGLTHGGFYRHFASKEELIEEAGSEAMRSIIDRLESAAKRSTSLGKGGLQNIIEQYLSKSHRDQSDTGCPFVALGSELVRSDRKIRARIQAESTRLVALISGFLDQTQYENTETEAQFIVASLMGALTYARIITDARESDMFLRDAAQRLVAHYCK